MKFSLSLATTLAASSIIAILAVAYAPAAMAQASLQVNPLKYEDKLDSDKVRSGFIDVANPGDAAVQVRASVQGFRQADLDGNLEFFDSETFSRAIKPGLTDFEIGPRESIRVTFTVEPSKLPPGGVYAVIFFRTVPNAVPSSATSRIFESANIGSLLLLQNGPIGHATGQLDTFNLSFFQTARGIQGSIKYKNLSTDNPSAIYPSFQVKTFPWGKPTTITGPFIMPGRSRRFDFEKPGSYLGLIPLFLTDKATNKTEVSWVLAATGRFSWLPPVLFASLITTLGYWIVAKHKLWRDQALKKLFKP